MPDSSFWHKLQEEALRFNWSEQANAPSQRSPSLDHNQHVNRDAAPAIGNHTPNAFQPQNRRSISLNLPHDRPTIHNAAGSFYQFGANPTGVALSEVPRLLPCSPEQPISRYERDQTWGEGSLESLSSTSTVQQRSLNPSAASKRNGTISLSNLDSVLRSHCSSVVPYNIIVQTDEAATERGRQGRPDDERTQMDQDPAHHNQTASDATRFQTDILSTAFGRDGDTSRSIDTGRSGVAECESVQGEDITISNDVLPIGKWRCCKCQRGHEIYRFEAGQHLISILNCLCKHRSCRSCTFHGNVRRFAPIDDAAGVASVPMPEGDGKTIRFGVTCRTCGLSWRAKRVEEAKRPGYLRRKLSILPKKVNPLHQLRNTRSMTHIGLPQDSHVNVCRPGSAMSTSRSTFNLRSALDAQEKNTKPVEQAQGALVRFYGIECTCGSISNASSVCFQVVDVAEVKSEGASKRQTGVKVTKTAQSHPAPDMVAKGYDTPTLHLIGGSHPNPLRSQPVQKSDLL